MTRLHALRLSEPSYLTLVIKKKPLNPVKLQCFKSIQLFLVKLKRNGKSSGYPYLNFLREKGYLVLSAELIMEIGHCVEFES